VSDLPRHTDPRRTAVQDRTQHIELCDRCKSEQSCDRFEALFRKVVATDGPQD
jgi:hypothetical protein